MLGKINTLFFICFQLRPTDSREGPSIHCPYPLRQGYFLKCTNSLLVVYSCDFEHCLKTKICMSSLTHVHSCLSKFCAWSSSMWRPCNLYTGSQVHMFLEDSERGIFSEGSTSAGWTRFASFLWPSSHPFRGKTPLRYRWRSLTHSITVSYRCTAGLPLLTLQRLTALN